MSDAKSQISKAEWSELRFRLADWYRGARRPLPWREETSLYRTVVSEFMCQQTQIDTVLPYFARWMNRFPTFAALAEAPEEAVLTAWSGLGYYARARNLQRLAQALVGLEKEPQTVEEWKKLPGIGPYTAAAICSIVFRLPEAVVDGNVIRVLSRVVGIESPFAHSQAASKAVQPLADLFLKRDDPGEHNQAVMELGATVCSKHQPSCLLCPLKIHCRSAGAPNVSSIPRIERRKTEKVIVNRLWFYSGGKVLLMKGSKTQSRLATIAELPEWPKEEPLEAAQLVAIKHRGISHQRIEERIYKAPEGFSVPPGRDFFLHDVKKVAEIPISGPHRRWIHEISIDSA